MKLILVLILIILNFIEFNQAVCTQRYCGIKGAQCIVHKGCAPGYYCGSNMVCTIGKEEDSKCNSNKECALGLKCINEGQYRVCKASKLKGLGEKCKSTSECFGSLVCNQNKNGGGGKCNFKKLNQCQFTEDCESSSFCNNKTKTCVPRLPIGSDCTFKEDQCTLDSICGKEDGRSNYLQGKCIKLFSKKIGESCFSPQFGECSMEDNLYCPTTSGSVSTCTLMYDRRKSCKSNSDCDTFWQECECDGKSSNSTCHSKFNIDGTCSKLYSQLQSCISSYSCSINNDINGIHETNSDSCIMKHCQQSAVCFYSRCLRSEFGGCKLPDSLKCTTDLLDDFSNFTLESRTGTYADNITNGPDSESITLKPKVTLKPTSHDDDTATTTDDTATTTSDDTTTDENNDKPSSSETSPNDNDKEHNNSNIISISLTLSILSLLLSLFV